MIGRIAITLGLVCAVLAVVYWLVPANALPSFLPGFDAGLDRVRIKHGVAAAVVAVLLFAIARFYGRRD